MLFLSLCGDNICNTTATPTNHRPIEMTHAPNIYKSTVSWSNLSDTKSTWSMNYSQHRMTFCHRPLRISMPPPVSSAIDSSGHDLIIEYRSPPHPKRIMFLFTTHHFKKIWLPPPPAPPMPKSLQESHHLRTQEISNKGQSSMQRAKSLYFTQSPLTTIAPMSPGMSFIQTPVFIWREKMSNWSVISDLDENVLRVLTLRTTTENSLKGLRSESLFSARSSSLSMI